jgi:hypothetical protein
MMNDDKEAVCLSKVIKIASPLVVPRGWIPIGDRYAAKPSTQHATTAVCGFMVRQALYRNTSNGLN